MISFIVISGTKTILREIRLWGKLSSKSGVTIDKYKEKEKHRLNFEAHNIIST